MGKALFLFKQALLYLFQIQGDGDPLEWSKDDPQFLAFPIHFSQTNLDPRFFIKHVSYSYVKVQIRDNCIPTTLSVRGELTSLVWSVILRLFVGIRLTLIKPLSNLTTMNSLFKLRFWLHNPLSLEFNPSLVFPLKTHSPSRGCRAPLASTKPIIVFQLE